MRTHQIEAPFLKALFITIDQLVNFFKAFFKGQPPGIVKVKSFRIETFGVEVGFPEDIHSVA